MATVVSAVEIAAIDHIVLRTRDPQRLERFYCEVLFCTVEKRQPGFGLTQLRAGDALIDLVDADRQKLAVPEPAHAAARNLEHFCLRLVRFDATALTAHLRRHGIEPGEIRERYGATGSGPSLYFDDPDGNTIELKAPADTAAKA
jgi:catechol 2,3-dioxygenase-like lactoylglutathione lyase family enzyme